MSKITPIIVENKGTLIIEEPNLPSLETKNTKNIIPFIDEQDNLILEMSGQGPQGPKGPTGNGIDRVTKTFLIKKSGTLTKGNNIIKRL